MRFTLELRLDNAAFTDDPQELARILHAIADSPDIASMGCRTLVAAEDGPKGKS